MRVRNGESKILIQSNSCQEKKMSGISLTACRQGPSVKFLVKYWVSDRESQNFFLQISGNSSVF
ncbi:hypothetical protein SAMN00777080_1372 [Aquiflexum balticum DSM 16537]|uniref:Uncharacterized protein n=1 Tax=Aquiflexum balticum DSM 16537 TaxID=758820 RepID=A0A1W2H1G8_9BACT|nr:hypothetical protein SAMN00777080_1372 [Aquiflexum balticum DSM 16537]